MSGSLATYVGTIAAFLASLSYIPQVRKAWPRDSTDDLSLGMLTALTLGLGLWAVYGLSRPTGLSCWPMWSAMGCKIRDLCA